MVIIACAKNGMFNPVLVC